MKPVVALRLPLGQDLRGFIALLERLKVPCRVSEDAGEQVLWVPDGHWAEEVRSLYARLPAGAPEPLLAGTPAPAGESAWRRARSSPVTLLVLLAALLVSLVTLMGENLALVRWFTFLDFHVQGDYLWFAPLSDTLSGQWWRLFSPILLHFWIPGMGPLHLVFNALWYWELGRRIEARQGGLMLVLLTLVFGLASNVAQYVYGGPGLFGGLSGVLYGLLGYCWLYQWLAPHPAFRLPRGVLAMMLGWLLLCLTGVFSLGGVAVANAAHVGGLLAGCASGLLGGALARWRR
ncbi:rhomboid family intramembrane serine protease [Pseudomonas mangiferae]|uniref:Rhomboid family intramembrane serine protease n=1 Tax=Pseudomonas mangiferae TaxID=2593654 RepID=A0A553GZ71_9PSED|nr:rhomboid family intramembrane serine protease [Pseudomonas mangiferae]TRX74805.1 rhomboid family intramembrane serine protease [Pseudomonas mangiferae]